jgi:hypothetical protein
LWWKGKLPQWKLQAPLQWKAEHQTYTFCNDEHEVIPGKEKVIPEPKHGGRSGRGSCRSGSSKHHFSRSTKRQTYAFRKDEHEVIPGKEEVIPEPKCGRRGSLYSGFS